MSHVVTISAKIRSLEALEKACNALGLTFVKNKHTYKWYGRSVGDYPLPEGFTEKDLGKCEHAIEVKNNSNAYSVGVVKSRVKGEEDCYSLLFDFWSGGYGLMDKVGKDAENLVQGYQTEIAKENMPSGWATEVTKLENGDIAVESQSEYGSF